MKIAALAVVTLREMLRRKVQVNLLVFGLLLLVSTYVVSELTLGEMHRIISDMGLSAMELIGTLIAVFLGASLVSGDAERRVLYPVIAKPITRTGYLAGRYLGLCAALLLNLVVMAAVLCAVLAFEANSLKPLTLTLLGAFAMIGVQLVVVAAVALLFSSLTSTTLAAIFALSLTAAGHLSNDLRAFGVGTGSSLARAVWYALPNLSALSANSAVIYGKALPATTLLAAAYGLLYALAALCVAALAFGRRDLR